MKVQSKSDSKKIGELVCDGAMKFVQNFAVEINGERVAEYLSLDAVAKDWKNYKPTEPLIEGRSQRAVLRAAAKLSGKTIVTVSRCVSADVVVFDFGSQCRVELKDRGINVKSRGVYTVPELCGEEK